MTSEVMEFCEYRRMMRPVQSIDSSALPAAPLSHVGTMVREWRTTRRLSQLELALEANVSPRHLLDTRLNPPAEIVEDQDTPQLLQIRIGT